MSGLLVAGMAIQQVMDSSEVTLMSSDGNMGLNERMIQSQLEEGGMQVDAPASQGLNGTFNENVAAVGLNVATPTPSTPELQPQAPKPEMSSGMDM
jgi:hypothetical protein